MQWWLTAEPKDQDLLETCGSQSRTGFLTVRGSRGNTKAYLRTEVWIPKFGDVDTTSTNFSKWWKDLKFLVITKGVVVEVEVENRMI